MLLKLVNMLSFNCHDVKCIFIDKVRNDHELNSLVKIMFEMLLDLDHIDDRFVNFGDDDLKFYGIIKHRAIALNDDFNTSPELTIIVDASEAFFEHHEKHIKC